MKLKNNSVIFINFYYLYFIITRFMLGSYFFHNLFNYSSFIFVSVDYYLILPSSLFKSSKSSLESLLFAFYLVIS